MITTPQLIASLAADAKPVRRLRPPLARAGLWLGAFVAIVAAVTWATGSWPLMIERLKLTRFAVEMTATLLTGIAAVVAAFYLSLPDRSRFWMLLPLPPLVLWLASSGYGCYENWITEGPQGWRLGRSSDCFIFILTMSIPVGVALYLALRRALPLDPLRVMAVGGLGVAALAATALQFYHPFDVTIIDLAVHVTAVLIVIGCVTLGGRWDLARLR
ncbi:MAG TPA: NrsF family protein [Micropepsaceae bacterium]|nr:NrsF family protein [Micropepsaceae bacterium]